MANITNRLSDCSSAVTSYISNISTMSESTAYQYFSRLKDFRDFIASGDGNRLNVDSLLLRMKKGKEDPYKLLNSYAAYLKNRNVSALTLKQRIVTLENFFEYCDIDTTQIQVKDKTS